MAKTKLNYPLGMRIGIALGQDEQIKYLQKKNNKLRRQLLNAHLESYIYIIMNPICHTSYCALEDANKKRLYYFVQTNRIKNCVTCHDCTKLIELKKKIIQLQMELGLPVWQLKYKKIMSKHHYFLHFLHAVPSFEKEVEMTNEEIKAAYFELYHPVGRFKDSRFEKIEDVLEIRYE